MEKIFQSVEEVLTDELFQAWYFKTDPVKVEQLSHRQKEIIYLKFYQNLSYDEVSSIMNINYQAARNLLYQAIKALKKIMIVVSGLHLTIGTW